MPRAMVLAAGHGTRLLPLTERCAKPLVPVGDRPMLAHVLGRLRAAGIDRVVVNAHHRAADVREFADGQPGVAVSNERDLLGTAGGVARARDLLGDGDVLLWNGDILADLDPLALLSAHATSAAEATLAVAPLPRGEGNVGIDEGGRIVRLRSERAAAEVRGGAFVGIHVIGPRLRTRLPPRGCLVGDAYIPALRQGSTLRAFWFSAPFFDVGTLRSYLDANLAWLAGRGSAGWIASNAAVAPTVTLDRTVVGAGAFVGGAGMLARCVVWPFSTAAAPLADAVVVGDVVVGVGDRPGASK